MAQDRLPPPPEDNPGEDYHKVVAAASCCQDSVEDMDWYKMVVHIAVPGKVALLPHALKKIQGHGQALQWCCVVAS